MAIKRTKAETLMVGLVLGKPRKNSYTSSTHILEQLGSLFRGDRALSLPIMFGLVLGATLGTSFHLRTSCALVLLVLVVRLTDILLLQVRSCTGRKMWVWTLSGLRKSRSLFRSLGNVPRTTVKCSVSILFFVLGFSLVLSLCSEPGWIIPQGIALLVFFVQEYLRLTVVIVYAESESPSDLHKTRRLISKAHLGDLAWACLKWQGMQHLLPMEMACVWGLVLGVVFEVHYAYLVYEVKVWTEGLVDYMDFMQSDSRGRPLSPYGWAYLQMLRREKALAERNLQAFLEAGPILWPFLVGTNLAYWITWLWRAFK